MGKLTQNKPKCLIPVNGTTILQTLSIAFPGATLYIIGDYKVDVLHSYLEVVQPIFKYVIIKASGYGTNAGISEALNFIPRGEMFAISWSDLFYQSPVSVLDENKNYVGVTNSNPCRYLFDGSKFREENTTFNGVIGLFLFKDKNLLSDIPDDGEFVKFLAQSNIKFSSLVLDSVYEIGTMNNYLIFKSKFPTSRFFNSIEMENDFIVKRPTDPKFKHLLADEISWYTYMENANFKGIPNMLAHEPLKLERIVGLHPHQIRGLSNDEKIDLIKQIIKRLHEVHSIQASPAVNQDLYSMYVIKTIERIRSAVRLLKVDSNTRFIVNGKKVEALAPDKPDKIIDLFNRLSAISFFSVIHGDPTFSNTFITANKEIKFIDPRGYFGNSKIFGDPRYDLAKLYYSAIGNYDQFNSGNFEIRKNFPEVEVKINSSQFEFTDAIFETYLQYSYNDIKILHALIWLSLSGYVLNDYDAIIAAYFMGLYYLGDVLND